jgi:hypothetical protein
MKRGLRVFQFLVLLGALLVLWGPRAEGRVPYCPSTDPCGSCVLDFTLPPIQYVGEVRCIAWDQWSHCCICDCAIESYNEWGELIGVTHINYIWPYCGCNPY